MAIDHRVEHGSNQCKLSQNNETEPVYAPVDAGPRQVAAGAPDRRNLHVCTYETDVATRNLRVGVAYPKPDISGLPQMIALATAST